MAVSCSSTEFKVWVPYGRGGPVSWRCRSVGSYRQRPILAAKFSPDGSILAVAASQFVTLWNPVTNSLLKVLSDATYYLDRPVTHLSFVNHSNCLLAASSGEKPTLTVWDISSLSIRWSLSLYVESVSVDPARSTFAVLASISSESTGNQTPCFPCSRTQSKPWSLYLFPLSRCCCSFVRRQITEATALLGCTRWIGRRLGVLLQR